MTLKEMLLLPKLSWKAKGLACTIQSNPEIFADEKVSRKAEKLVLLARDGFTSVNTGLKELRKAGILKGQVVRIEANAKTRAVVGTRWTITVEENK